MNKAFVKLNHGEGIVRNINFGKYTDRIEADYSDIHEGIQVELNFIQNLMNQ